MSTVFYGARKLDARGQVDDFWMLVEDGSIVSTGSGPSRPVSTTNIDVDGQWLVPGFIDLHCHGGGGYSFDDGLDQIHAALALHRAHGTTRSVISLVSAPLPSLLVSLAAIANLTESDPLVLGSHLEGPFISSSFRGAHAAEYLRDPEPVDVDRLIGAARSSLRQVTLAPELPGAMEAIDVLVAAGIVVALGHSGADSALAQESFDRGIRLVTHLFNAMPGIHHRSPGPVLAALNDERVIVELILDGHHVHPDIASLVFATAPGRVALVTDAMAATGAGDGDFRLGTVEVAVHNGVARVRGTTTIAGSSLTQDQALRMALGQSRISPASAIEALTHTPARVLGLEHRHGLLAPGFIADAVFCDTQWNVRRVFANGAEISRT